jgi:hypothetical protein
MSGGGSERRLSILGFGGGNETPLNIAGSPTAWRWTDSVTVIVTRQTATGLRVSLVDVRNGGATRSTEIPDSLVAAVTPLPDGWAWIAQNRDKVVIQQGGKTAEIPKPAWFGSLVGLSADPDGRRLAITGWNAGTSDSVGVALVPVAGGTPALWGASPAEEVNANFLDDGSILFTVWDTPESAVLYRVTGPGQLERLGSVPRPIANVNVSRDLKRIAVHGARNSSCYFLSLRWFFP